MLKHTCHVSLPVFGGAVNRRDLTITSASVACSSINKAAEERAPLRRLAREADDQQTQAKQKLCLAVKDYADTRSRCCRETSVPLALLREGEYPFSAKYNNIQRQSEPI